MRISVYFIAALLAALGWLVWRLPTVRRFGRRFAGERRETNGGGLSGFKIAAALLTAFVIYNAYRLDVVNSTVQQAFERQLEKTLDADVQVGKVESSINPFSLRFNPFNPYFEYRSIVIKPRNPALYVKDIKIRRLTMEINFEELYREDIDVERMVIEGASVLCSREKFQPADLKIIQPADPDATGEFRLRKLEMKDCAVEMSDPNIWDHAGMAQFLEKIGAARAPGDTCPYTLSKIDFNLRLSFDTLGLESGKFLGEFHEPVLGRIFFHGRIDNRLFRLFLPRSMYYLPGGVARTLVGNLKETFERFDFSGHFEIASEIRFDYVSGDLHHHTSIFPQGLDVRHYRFRFPMTTYSDPRVKSPILIENDWIVATNIWAEESRRSTLFGAHMPRAVAFEFDKAGTDADEISCPNVEAGLKIGVTPICGTGLSVSGEPGILIDGYWDGINFEDPMGISIKGVDVPFTDTLKNALPHKGSRDVWEMLKPGGRFDIDVAVSKPQRGALPTRVDFEADVKDASIEYVNYPFRIASLDGRYVYDGRNTFLSDFIGTGMSGTNETTRHGGEVRIMPGSKITNDNIFLDIRATGVSWNSFVAAFCESLKRNPWFHDGLLMVLEASEITGDLDIHNLKIDYDFSKKFLKFDGCNFAFKSREFFILSGFLGKRMMFSDVDAEVTVRRGEIQFPNEETLDDALRTRIRPTGRIRYPAVANEIPGRASPFFKSANIDIEGTMRSFKFLGIPVRDIRFDGSIATSNAPNAPRRVTVEIKNLRGIVGKVSPDGKTSPPTGGAFRANVKYETDEKFNILRYRISMALDNARMENVLGYYGEDIARESGIRGNLNVQFEIEGSLFPEMTATGNGAIEIKNGEIIRLPPFANTLINLINLNLPRDTLFSESIIRFSILNDRISFDKMKFYSTDYLLRGEGSIFLDGRLDLIFMSEAAHEFPIIKPVTEPLAYVKDNILSVKVGGTLKNPTYTPLPFGNFPARTRELYEDIKRELEKVPGDILKP